MGGCELPHNNALGGCKLPSQQCPGSGLWDAPLLLVGVHIWGGLAPVSSAWDYPAGISLGSAGLGGGRYWGSWGW